MELDCHMVFDAPSVKEKKLIWLLLDGNSKIDSKNEFISLSKDINPEDGESLSKKLFEYADLDEIRGEGFNPKKNKTRVTFNYFGGSLSENIYHSILYFIDGLFSDVKISANITFDGMLEHDIKITNGKMTIKETGDM
jgi:hypothetical protein